MRKKIISTSEEGRKPASAADWLSLEELASVEVSSETADRPIEGVFSGTGDWKAATTGPQTIRLLFTEPQHVTKIRLEFLETELERMQEFVLGYSEQENGPLQEIIRQQWTFSPQGSTVETEDYTVNLRQVRMLQLRIDPDRGQDRTPATLHRWLIA